MWWVKTENKKSYNSDLKVSQSLKVTVESEFSSQPGLIFLIWQVTEIIPTVFDIYVKSAETKGSVSEEGASINAGVTRQRDVTVEQERSQIMDRFRRNGCWNTSECECMF